MLDVAMPIAYDSTTVSMASTPVHNLLKTAVRRKIQLEETEKCLLQVPVVDVLSKVVWNNLNFLYVHINTV